MPFNLNSKNIGFLGHLGCESHASFLHRFYTFRAVASIELTYMLSHLAHPRAVEGRATGVVLRALGRRRGAPLSASAYPALSAFVTWSWSPGGVHGSVNHTIMRRLRAS